MRLQLRIPTGSSVIFTDDAVQSLIGQMPELNAREIPDGPLTAALGTGEIVAATLTDEGSAILLTIETQP